jgi:hypothetical protein
MIQNGIDHQPPKKVTAAATTTAIARKGQPSFATMGCG